jgi:hypothetical protein
MSDDDGAIIFHHYDPKFPKLKEVILVAAGGNMLPDKWGERTLSFWDKELSSMKASWLVE